MPNQKDLLVYISHNTAKTNINTMWVPLVGAIMICLYLAQHPVQSFLLIIALVIGIVAYIKRLNKLEKYYTPYFNNINMEKKKRGKK